MSRVNTVKETATFVGVHPDDEGMAICGVLTEDLDRADAPFFYSIEGDMASIFSAGKDMEFRVPQALIMAVAAGALFYVANIGGSEESWLAKPHSLQ